MYAIRRNQRYKKQDIQPLADMNYRPDTFQFTYHHHEPYWKKNLCQNLPTVDELLNLSTIRRAGVIVGM